MGLSPMRKFLIVTIVSTLIIIVTYFLPSGVWAEFGGLPAHPLIIHAVVVLLPLLAIFLLVGLFWKHLIRKLHLPLIGALALSVVGVLAAKSSGYSLSVVVGLPKSHAQWGNYLVLLAIALFSSFVLFSYFTFYKRIKTASSSLRVLMAILAVSAIVMTYVVGHSGAASVWKYKYNSVKDQQGLP
jgi:Na+/H+-translocating membrane pyrophosphatase